MKHLTAVVFAFALLATSSLPSQDVDLPGLDGLDFGGITPSGGLAGDSEALKLTASFQMERGTTNGRVTVDAELDPAWKLYSNTQPKGGPSRTEISVAPSQSAELTGAFEATVDPEMIQEEFFEVVSEIHHGKVSWTAPVRFPDGTDVESATVEIRFLGQRCREGACVPIDESLTASFAGFYEPVTPTGQYRAERSHVTWSGYLDAVTATPGGTVNLVLTATADPTWHVYDLAEEDPMETAKPTLIVLAKKSGLRASAPQASAVPVTKTSDNGDSLSYHKQSITWTVKLEIPRDIPVGEVALAGLIGYQTCTDVSCDRPRAAEFSVTLPISSSAGAAGKLPLAFQKANYSQVADHPNLLKWVDVKELNLGSLLATIGFGFLGGLILNLMPCVLPVIGLKILSFAEQAGHSRAKILSLNVWFSAGLVLVFMVLATLAAFLNMGWGEQFTLTWFKVAMAGLVFAMALSFLGVWEIPIPGFMGSGHSNKLQESEGASGAFFKGVFTTVLATPCSGPFLGPVFALTLTQPPYVIYLLFASVGLGMASPYLTIGVFPALIKFLPKPGAWMDTFKQLMGFVLLATVVYLFTTISAGFFIPTLTLLIGIWFACWWIGRTPVYAEFAQKATAWGGGCLVAAVVGFSAFTVLAEEKALLPWQPYSPAALAQAQKEGKTVLVDFTADWCLTCKYNLKYAINTNAVSDVVQKNEVVTLLADWTDRSPKIKQSLAQLNAASIPLLAIYPSGGGEPIVLQDTLVESKVLDALKSAGPSKPSDPATASLPE